jgi:hypothetical protein
MTLSLGYGLNDLAGVGLIRLQSRAFMLCAPGGRPTGRGHHHAPAHGGRQGGVHAAVTVRDVLASGGVG